MVIRLQNLTCSSPVKQRPKKCLWKKITPLLHVGHGSEDGLERVAAQGLLPASASVTGMCSRQTSHLPIYQTPYQSETIDSLVAQMVKHLSTMGETWVQALGWEDPWRRKWQSTPVLSPGKSHGQRSLVGYSVWGRRESDTTEWLHFHFHYKVYQI